MTITKTAVSLLGGAKHRVVNMKNPKDPSTGSKVLKWLKKVGALSANRFKVTLKATLKTQKSKLQKLRASLKARALKVPLKTLSMSIRLCCGGKDFNSLKDLKTKHIFVL